MSDRWVIASGDFTTLGGMDRANHALARYLAAHGREVHLVAHRVSDDLRSLAGVIVHDVARPSGAHLLGAPILARAVRSIIRRVGRGARVLINGGNAAVGAASWIHYLHAAYVPDTAGPLRAKVTAAVGRRMFVRAERRAIGRAPLLVCNSERTAEDVRSAYGGGAAQVVYYGVDPGAFGPVPPSERARARASVGVADGRLNALFVGALGDRRKGFDVLFDAWRTLAGDASWDVDLIVAGTGGERAAWQARASRAGLSSRIRFLGFRADVAEVMAAADVLVHPARYEAYGLAVHEAICRGVPALVTANAGIAERYPKALGGLVLPSGVTMPQLVNALRAWRGSEACWRDRVGPFGAALRARTWDDMAADVAAAVEAAS